jgi:hypothetical protein
MIWLSAVRLSTKLDRLGSGGTSNRPIQTLLPFARGKRKRGETPKHIDAKPQSPVNAGAMHVSPLRKLASFLLPIRVADKRKGNI